MNTQELEGKIKRIKEEIAALGSLRPGTLYERGNVCGRPGCRCGRADNPVKHGPYHYLSYTFEGKSHTEFVRAKDLTRVKKEIRNYQRLMDLVKELVDCGIKSAKLRKSE